MSNSNPHSTAPVMNAPPAAPETVDGVPPRGDEPVARADAAAAPTPAAAPPAAAAAAIAPENMTLPQMDQALAEDFDKMLQGNFESIDAVLEGVFEEQAVLVQKADGSPAVPNVKHPPAPAAESAPPAPSAAVAPVMEPPAAPAPAATVVESAPVLEAPPPPMAPTEPANDAAKVPPAKSPKPARTFDPFQYLKMGLAILNFPWRFVPPSLRPILNWVAITMVVWVPIVWVMALRSAAAGDGHAAKGDGAEAVHESAPAEIPHETAPEAPHAPAAPAHENSRGGGHGH